MFAHIYVNVLLCVCENVCLCVCEFFCLCVWVFACVYVSVFSYVYVSVFVSVFACVYVCLPVYMWVCLPVCMWLCLWVCLSVCLWLRCLQRPEVWDSPGAGVQLIVNTWWCSKLSSGPPQEHGLFVLCHWNSSPVFSSLSFVHELPSHWKSSFLTVVTESLTYLSCHIHKIISE